MAEYANDPERYAEEVLGVTLHEDQRAILRSLVGKDVTAVRSCHGIGKSFIAAVAVLWFISSHLPAKVITTAPTNRQVEGVLWAEIRSLWRKAKMSIGGDIKIRRWDLSDDWFAMGFAPREWDPSAFQGFHSLHMMVVVDEAAGVSDVVFDGVKALLGGEHSRLLMIGNPTHEAGAFGKAFKASDKFTAKHVVSAFDTPNFKAYGITLEDIRSGAWEAKITGPLPFPSLVTPKWVRMQWEDWCGGTEQGEESPLWQARVMANFPVITDGMLIPLAWVEAAQARWWDLDDVDGWEGPPTYGIDVARYGEDSNVIAARHAGQGTRQLHERRNSAITATSGWVNFCALQEEGGVAQRRIDGDGLGAGLVDMQRDDHGGDVVEMRGGSSPLQPERFVNARSEWYWQLREALDPSRGAKECLPPDSQLAAQLCSIKYDYDNKGRIKVESKDDMRARRLKSPDKADAVVYAHARLGSASVVPMVDPEVGHVSNVWKMGA